MTRMTLERGQWYAWTMYPGYGDEPYYSPILVRDIEPLADRQFRLDFLNLAYAAGVQNMSCDLKTVKREATYLVAVRPDTDRTIIIEPLTKRGLLQYFPHLSREIEALAVRTDEEQVARWLKNQMPAQPREETD